MVPEDAPMIQAVRGGNLKEFVRLLENGQAKVWDCDSEGRSLVTVISSRRSIMIVHGTKTLTRLRFFIQNPKWLSISLRRGWM